MWRRTLLRTLAAVPVGIGMKLHANDRDAIKEHADGCNPVCMLQAKSKKDKKDEETKEKRVRKMESRFESFATIQVDGQCFMTPADFLEAVTEAAPRKSAYKKSFSRDEVLKRLRDTTPITPNSDIKNDTEFFRKLGQNGIISFNEYLFLLCIITKPRQGFEVAFKMFDTDGNQEIDFEEFKVLEDIFSQSAQNSIRKDRGDGERFPTTLSIFFFGEDGNGTLSHQHFYDFMHNLQSEVLELEFNEFARGKWEITELEFAEMLMRYTDSWDMDEQIKEVKTRLKNQKGITLDEFKAFFFFLNNLEDFSTAVHYYSLANQPIGPHEFARAVKISTGETLSMNLVNTVYAIFDKDGDQKLSHKEFIGVMSDRFARQQKILLGPWIFSSRFQVVVSEVSGQMYLLKNKPKTKHEKFKQCFNQKMNSEE